MGRVKNTSIVMVKSRDFKILGTRPLAVAGIRLAATSADLRYHNRDDVALIELCEGTIAAGMFTRNRFKAAPVIVSQEHLAKCSPRYLLINAGIANAGVGSQGIADAKYCCRALGRLGSVQVESVLPFSTGVIGQPLPSKKIEAVLPDLLSSLSDNHWLDVAAAMMTTDTMPKSEGVRRVYGRIDSPVTITGIAKGAGMICPNMATMLAFVATDMELSVAEAQKLLSEACEISFHSITIDGDTSTNDACMLLATGSSGVQFSSLNDLERVAFSETLAQLMQGLAKSIVRDAEGASRFVTIKVECAPDISTARSVAMTVAHSPLVKTALFSGDPNWGRVLAAIGRAPCDIDIDKVDFYFDNSRVVAGGEIDSNYDEAQGVTALAGSDVLIRIVLGMGDALAQVWTSDLTTDYVKINANYRS